MNKNSKIYIAGHKGLVGSAILRKLEANGYTNIITRTHKELDLTNQKETQTFFEKEKPEYVFLAAAKVGGIIANRDYPADAIYDNLQIQNNVINSSYKIKVKKLLFLGSSCIYPKFAEQPMKESSLLTGLLEPTNEPYAIAKIAGIKMCQSYNRQYGTNYIACMPTNLYGINDNFDPITSHVLPAIIRKVHEAKMNNIKEITIWGTGKPKREFLHVDDLANAGIFLMQNYNPTKEDNENGDIFVNAGVGKEIEIIELTKLIANIIGYTGEIKTDTTKPDGTPRKLVDVAKINNLGWNATIDLKDGIKETYNWFINNKL